jgi:uncharacterized protein YebE (UPF0316 family)
VLYGFDGSNFELIEFGAGVGSWAAGRDVERMRAAMGTIRRYKGHLGGVNIVSQ